MVLMLSKLGRTTEFSGYYPIWGDGWRRLAGPKLTDHWFARILSFGQDPGCLCCDAAFASHAMGEAGDWGLEIRV